MESTEHKYTHLCHLISVGQVSGFVPHEVHIEQPFFSCRILNLLDLFNLLQVPNKTGRVFSLTFLYAD